MSLSLKRFSLPILVVSAAVCAFALLLASLNAANADSSPPRSPDEGVMASKQVQDSDKDAYPDASAELASKLANAAVSQEASVYIVVLEDESLAQYRGGVAGYPATSRHVTGDEKLNPRSLESLNYLSYLESRRADVIRAADMTIGRKLDIMYEYGATLVGFATELTPSEADQIATLPNVRFVEKERISEPQTDSGPQWAGATEVWGGTWNSLAYKATLSGANETTPVTSTVTGMGTFSYNFYTNELSYTISVENPDGVNLTMMHIHNAPAGSDGGVIHNFGITATTGDLMETGIVALSDPEEAALVNKELYINVHSDVNGAGEVRGQIELYGSLGEGIVVGVIDTGIDPWNPSFAAVGGDGYVHTNPKGEGVYVGVCDSADATYDATFPCNSKLIGARGYDSIAGSPRDSNGHGSHTAGTAAGNIVFDAVAVAPTEVFTSDISGVAPHANIIAYAACCTGAALNASRDQALLDGVDVINYSIGSSAPTGDLWADSESIQWLALRDAGVFVATSNGNDGNGDATTGSPSDLPWITSVGASSHNRAFLVTFTLTDTNNTTVSVQGQAMTSGYGPAEVIFSTHYSDTDDARLCAPNAFAAGTFNNEIVICERGQYGRVAKGESALAGGAGGFVLAQPDEATGGPGAVAADTHALPAIHIDYYQYQILRQFLMTDAVGTVMGDLSGATLDVNDSHGDIMASFSSRGPSGSDADLIVPNVTAPGRAIWAAYHQGDNDGDYTFNVIQGTSMSSPHVAGAGALLSALHPNWTPAEIESALMMTARDTVLDDDGMTTATPFAQGAGHIDVAKAAMSPLIMDVTKAQYEAADPSVDNGFFVKDLNIASFGEDACVGTCSWTRSFENASSETLTWTLDFNFPVSVTGSVTPAMFSLAPGASQSVDIMLNVLDAPINGEWLFGSLKLDEMSGMYPDAHLPFAILPSAGNIPETLAINTQTTSGSVDMKDLVSIDIANMQLNAVGLVKADRHAFTLPQDNDNQADFPDIFFDDVTTTKFISMEVPANSFSVIAEIVETESPDLDMLLFLDGDANGPDLGDATGDNFCQSASGGSLETCEILSPAAGTYYVAIINWSSADPTGDAVDLATAVVANGGTDEGNMTVTGPATVADQEPYTITVAYDDSSMTAVDKLYGYFTIGSDAGMLDDVATVRVALTYLGVPDVSIDPTELSSTQPPDVNMTEVLTLSTVGGVLDWTTVIPNGTEGVQDGSFEEGYADNPYWRADASQFGGLLPICSAATCGPNLATDGDWFIWFGGVAGQTSFAEQDVTIAEGDVANLTFNMLMGTADPLTATAKLTVSLEGTTIAVYTETALADFGTYPTVDLDVSAYADGGSHLLKFDFENSPGYNFNIFIDEVSIVSVPAEALTCNVIGNIPWLNVSPSSGSLSPGSMPLDVSFNSTGLGAGTYTNTLCMNSNDPDESVIGVPVTMTVVLPEMNVSPTAISESVDGGNQVTATMTISNTGDGALNWAIGEVNKAASSDALTPTVYVEEEFSEIFPPAGWTVENAIGSGSMWISTTSAYAGSHGAVVPYVNPTSVETWLISPSFDTGASDALLDFHSLGSLYWCRDGFDLCHLDVWLVVGETAGDADDVYLGRADNDWTATYVWSPTRMLIPANSGAVRIGFQVVSNDGATVALDSIRVMQRTSPCEYLSDIPWVSTSSASGTVDPHSSSNVDIMLDNTGLGPGTHTKTICVFGNDPANPVATVPVTLTVANQPNPQVETESPVALSVGDSNTVTHTVRVSNIGDASGTFTATVSGNTWDTKVLISDASLNVRRAAVDIHVIVTVPMSATSGMSDSVTLTVTSETGAPLSDSIVLTTAKPSVHVYLPTILRE